MKTKLLVKNAIRCKRCGDVIVSKYRHNFVTCSCGACSADGGIDYLRRCGNLEDWEELSEYKEIDLTPKYKVGDKVEFKTFRHLDNLQKTGIIQTIDVYPCSTIIEYDIFVESEPCLYKHVIEENVLKKTND